MIKNRAAHPETPANTKAGPAGLSSAENTCATEAVGAATKPVASIRKGTKATEVAGAPRKLTLKDMVQGAHTTARAVRFYETENLIAPAGRSQGGHRMFEPEELGKLRLVLEMRTCGFSIEEIREILSAKDHHASVSESAQHIQRILATHITELHRKIAVIERLGREFHTTIDLLTRCVQCKDPRGPEACKSCDLPLAPTTPETFARIWSVPRVKAAP